MASSGISHQHQQTLKKKSETKRQQKPFKTNLSAKSLRFPLSRSTRSGKHMKKLWPLTISRRPILSPSKDQSHKIQRKKKLPVTWVTQNVSINGLVCWGKSTGNHGFYHQIYGFPGKKFPSSNSMIVIYSNTTINHPYGLMVYTNIYQAFLVIWGMVYRFSSTFFYHKCLWIQVSS